MFDMSTPLRRLRLSRNLTLAEVGRAVSIDPANLSRIETMKQPASPELAEKLVAYYGADAISELHVLYPQRFSGKTRETAA